MTTEEHKEHDKEAEESIIAIVEKYGWYVAMFHATDYLPSFAYTIGLWKTFGHPEIISFGLKAETLGVILNIAGDMIKEGETLQVTHDYDDFFQQAPAQFVNVHEGSLKDYFGYGLWYNKHKTFPALQLVWTDRLNRFPWEAGFEEEFVLKQPLLDRNFDFKFRKERNMAAFTTRQWIELKKPILRVVHDHNGDWQFLTGDQMLEDIKIVALEELVQRDETLNDIFNLGYGEAAERESPGGAWIRSKLDEEEE